MGMREIQSANMRSLYLNDKSGFAFIKVSLLLYHLNSFR